MHDGQDPGERSDPAARSPSALVQNLSNASERGAKYVTPWRQFMNRRPTVRRRKRAVFVIGFVGIAATASLGTAQAAELASPLTMKPLQGVSFDIGTKRAVSYFLSDGNSCKLTLMLAEVVHGDDVNGLTATSVTVAIEAGKAAHLDTVEGKTLEFKCQGGAHMMSV